MSWLRQNHPGNIYGSGRPCSSRPGLEELEPRLALSAATTAVASSFVHSPESLAGFVTTEYVQLLKRAPTPAEGAAWVGQLQQGMSFEAVEAAIASSPEDFQDHGGTAAGWLTGLYQDLLGRAPDAAGLNAWLGQLAAGAGLSAVATAFATAAEREARVVTEDFTALLGRTPSSGDLAAGLGALRQGATRADVAAAVLGSDEFFQRQGDDNTDFVRALYQDVLHRTPTADELNGWLPTLAQSCPGGMVGDTGIAIGPGNCAM